MFKFRKYKRLPPTPLTKFPSQRQSLLLASPVSFQKHFYTKEASFFPHKEGIYLKSTLCSKPSADSITYGKDQALQPGIQGSLCHISFPASPLHTQCSGGITVLRNGTTRCSPNSPSPLGLCPHGEEALGHHLGQSALQSLCPCSKGSMLYTLFCIFPFPFNVF